MKIAITGHTGGLGQALFETLSTQHDVVGFSRSNGYDISKNANDIVEKIKDYDILINNAYHVTGQLGLLRKMYEVWSGQYKLIVTVGSGAAHNPNIRLENPNIPEEFLLSKIAHNKFVQEFCPGDKLPYVTYMSLGTLGKTTEDFLTKLRPKDIAELVASMLQLYQHNNVVINPLLVFPKKKT